MTSVGDSPKWSSSSCVSLTRNLTEVTARIHGLNDVSHPNARRYFSADREAGDVLPCTANPRANTTVVVDQYDDFLELRASNDGLPGNSKLND